MVTLPHISLHSKKEETKGRRRDCPVLQPGFEIGSEELVKGEVAVLQALPPHRKHSSQNHEVLKQLNVFHLPEELISREMSSSQRISQGMSQVKIM